MEREEVATHYVSNRLSLWCPICGAVEGKSCKPVKGLRFESHDSYAAGTIYKPVAPIITGEFERLPVRKPGFTPKGWVN